MDHRFVLMTNEIHLRLMTEDDIPFAMELKNLAGWNQTHRDWQSYLLYEPAGCFVAECESTAAGTATTIRYEDRIGWIGMVLVHPDMRRLGIGTCLLNHAIGYLNSKGTTSIKLDATPMGMKVYEPLGFQPEYEVVRMEVSATTPVPGETSPAGVILPMRSRDLDSVSPTDRRIFGADRDRVLQRLHSMAPDLCFVSRDPSGAITGFIFARPGHEADQIGPWIADTPQAAECLLRAVLHSLEGRRVFLDVPLANPAALPLVEQCGFHRQRTLTRMVLGENRHPGVPERVYGISSPEKG